jgi:nucleoside-diphosphate-sugar epimerase
LNIGTGLPTSILKLRREMTRFFSDADKIPIFLSTVSGDIRHSTACITAAAEVLGFSPRYSLQDGLAELFQDSVKLCKSHGASEQEMP